MIGGEIFQTMDNGYISFNNDCELNLSLIAQGKFSELEGKPGVDVNISKALDFDCKGWKASDDDDEISSDRKIRMVAKIRSFPMYSKQEKMSVSYKHKRGRFREHRTHMSVNIDCRLNSNACGEDAILPRKSHNTYKKKKRRDIHTTVWGGGYVLAPNRSGVTGTHRHYTSEKPSYSLRW
jgi:hypothetical protein